MNLKFSHIGGSSYTWSGIRTRVIVIHIAPENEMRWPKEKTEGLPFSWAASYLAIRPFFPTLPVNFIPSILFIVVQVTVAFAEAWINIQQESRSLSTMVRYQLRDRQVGDLLCWSYKKLQKVGQLYSREDISPSVWWMCAITRRRPNTFDVITMLLLISLFVSFFFRKETEESGQNHVLWEEFIFQQCSQQVDNSYQVWVCPYHV